MTTAFRNHQFHQYFGTPIGWLLVGPRTQNTTILAAAEPPPEKSHQDTVLDSP
ncbi:hypothetical protein BDN67DRAFT_975826 [Paxillus ammoniavirescens]|nr:hypothetical protein BDN67DRAFT_975826 [Paxillus ammoniavirescens]